MNHAGRSSSHCLWLTVVGIALGLTVSAPAQPLIAPSTTNTNFVVVCLDQFGNVVPNCNVTVGSGVVLNSNGHFHDSPTRPIGTITPTSGNTGTTGLPITIRTTQVGQQEVVISCIPTRCDASPYNVGHGDLFMLAPGDGYQLVGGNTTMHGDDRFNHFGTSTMISGILNTVFGHLAAHPTQGRVALNDMALPIGGIFDLNRNWVGPHHNHSRGTAVDVRGNSLAFAIPLALQNEFVQRCRDNGATLAMTEFPANDPNRHIHCQW